MGIMDHILKDAAPVSNSFYCFSTYMADTGKTKMTVDELGNLQLQYRRQIGIFQCEQWQVFSDGDAELAPGVPFVKVYDADGDFHFAKRKETPSQGIQSLKGPLDLWHFLSSSLPLLALRSLSRLRSIEARMGNVFVQLSASMAARVCTELLTRPPRHGS